MATTFAILAVFIPVAFMSGVIGRFFLQFGITVAVAVLVSLFVSFTLDPMLSSIWPDPSEGRFRRVPWLGRVMERVESVVECAHVVYDRLLRWALSGRRYGIQSRRCRASARALLLLGLAAAVVLRQLHDRAADRHRVRAAAGRGHGVMRLNTPIGSSLRIHRREDSRRRSGDSRDRGRRQHRHDRRHRRRQELRARRRRAGRSRAEQASAAERDREADPRAPGAHGRARRLDRPGNNQPGRRSRMLGPDSGKLTELSQELMARLAKIPGHRRPGEQREGREPDRSPCASTTSWPATSASRPPRSATRCGR